MRTQTLTQEGRLIACRLSELNKRVLRKAGYAIHPTSDPGTAWHCESMPVPQFSGFSNLWELVSVITKCDTLSDMLAQGILLPEKDFWQAKWLVTGHSDFFQEACAMPMRDLGKFSKDGLLWHLAKGVLHSLRRSYGLAIAYAMENGWETHTKGLESYLCYGSDAPFLHALYDALKVRPDARKLLAFPIRPDSVINCKPLGIWLASPNKIGRQKAYAIQVDC